MKFVKKNILYILTGCFLVFFVSQFLPSSKRDWIIKESAVGDLEIGTPLPAYVLALTPYFYSGKYGDKLPEVGLYIDKVDLRIVLKYYFIIKSIYPGPRFKTVAGTGAGTTMEELHLAHGKLEIHTITGPNRCAISTPKLSDVYFEFKDCSSANKGAGVIRVVIRDLSDL